MKPILLSAPLALMLLLGCGENPTQAMATGGTGGSPRFTVERVGVFEDSLAYDSRRGIYMIRDRTTGQEFVGVSGVGISELGNHTVQSGKTTQVISDER